MATLISWTDETWNPTTGCTRVSAGCANCYAEALSLRFGWSKFPWTKPNEEANLVLHPERLRKPYSWKKPSRVFVNSMSDLFHDLIPDEYIARVFAVMADTPQHTYQILTKRAERAASWPGPWPENIWQGVSVEDARNLPRVDALRRCGARTKFISAEPLLGPIVPGLDLTGIDWIIVGGESGRNFRPWDLQWARDIRDLCPATGTAFFFKQDAALVTETRPHLDGWVWHQYPGHLDPPTPYVPPVKKGKARVA